MGFFRQILAGFGRGFNRPPGNVERQRVWDSRFRTVSHRGAMRQHNRGKKKGRIAPPLFY